MQHNTTNEEKNYTQSFHNTTLNISGFHHKQHILVTYVLLNQYDIKQTYQNIKKGILNILNSVGADTTKYHETMTYGWVLLVKYFMNHTKTCHNFEEFLSLNKQLLNTDILYNYYSKELIKNEDSRLNIINPDMKKIQVH